MKAGASGVGVVSHLTWVLGTEFWFFTRAMITPAPILKHFCTLKEILGLERWLSG